MIIKVTMKMLIGRQHYLLIHLLLLEAAEETDLKCMTDHLLF